MSFFFLPNFPAILLMASSIPVSSDISISSVTAILGPLRSDVLAASLTNFSDTVQSQVRLRMESTPIKAAVIILGKKRESN